MVRVMVVDDSPVDRRLVGGLLAKNQHFQVEYATSGTEALAALRRAPVDVVVTDLVMPQMDGLALVAAVKRQFPLVPIVLMTSQGTEEIAVRALQEGASSYVPKRALAQELLDTVQNVVAVSGQRRSQELLFHSMLRNECEFSLSNDCGLIPPLVNHFQETLAGLGVCDDSDRIRVGIALEEALANALYHGNLEVNSDLLNADYAEYHRLVEERLRSPPYCDRRIRVLARMSRAEAVFTIRDDGPGFQPADLPDPCAPANLDRVSGRGVLLMRTFMDDVAYNDSGNEVTLVKRAGPVRSEVVVEEG
jgi:CheY-like chemotaxis protein/anti-sigma regulatory factor (Ser/Thr protein kinase)